MSIKFATDIEYRHIHTKNICENVCKEKCLKLIKWQEKKHFFCIEHKLLDHDIRWLYSNEFIDVACIIFHLNKYLIFVLNHLKQSPFCCSSGNMCIQCKQFYPHFYISASLLSLSLSLTISLSVGQAAQWPWNMAHYAALLIIIQHYTLNLNAV